MVIFHLRAAKANGDTSLSGVAFVTYQQVSFGMGLIQIATDVARLAKCLLVNATYGPEKYPESPAAANKEGVVFPPSADTPDQPQARTSYRLATGFLGLTFFVALVTGIVANSYYTNDISQSNANLIANARFVLFFLGRGDDLILKLTA